MGREVRRVPADWQHPQLGGTYSDGSIRYKGLFDGSGLADRVAEYDADKAKWEAGEFPSYVSEESKAMTYEEYAGERPSADDYMPVWTPEQTTHYMMYETCSEGSPISPAFATPQELARWLTDKEASSFAGRTATYEQWLRVCCGGFAPSAVIDASGLRSGVEL